MQGNVRTTSEYLSQHIHECLSGKYIQIAGSANENTELDIIQYSHHLIREITKQLLRSGAKLIVGVGSEELINDSNPSWDKALYYDWNVLETIGEYIDSEVSIQSQLQLPLVMVVSSEKSESEIPKHRQRLWNQLIDAEAICLKYLPSGWNAGAVKRNLEAEFGAGLIIIGGGEGVEHSSTLYVNSGKPVIPIDLPITSRHNDGKGGAVKIFQQALLNPTMYIGCLNNAATRLARISPQKGVVPIEKIAPNILMLLSDSISDLDKSKEKLNKNSSKVFVVHGRNYAIQQAMFTFLRSIGLQPIEWIEAIKLTGKGSPHISEILDAAFDSAHAIVVLLTPDDEARLRLEYQSNSDPNHEKDLTGQARANVIFEAGMALGRDEKRTILVEFGNLRPFSDIAGRHTIRFDNSTEKRQELAMRLQTAGCNVNLDGTDWHKAGDFIT